ncbi:MAG: carboxypeptidase-like regulatory domain-containing protein [Ferruginibacter sp.]
MKAKLTMILSVILFFTAGLQKANAQSGAVKGRITTSDGHAVAGVTLTTKDNKRMAVTDNNGFFYIKQNNSRATSDCNFLCRTENRRKNNNSNCKPGCRVKCYFI